MSELLYGAVLSEHDLLRLSVEFVLIIYNELGTKAFGTHGTSPLRVDLKQVLHDVLSFLDLRSITLSNDLRRRARALRNDSKRTELRRLLGRVVTPFLGEHRAI